MLTKLCPYSVKTMTMETYKTVAYRMETIEQVFENIAYYILKQVQTETSLYTIYQDQNELETNLYNVYQDALQEGHASMTYSWFTVTISIDPQKQSFQIDMLIRNSKTKQLQFLMVVKGPIEA